MVFLTDGDGADWREVQRNERASFPNERLFMAVHGVPDRNVECWICSDADFISQKLGVAADELRVTDPKGRLESALKVNRDEKKEEEIEDLVHATPLRTWLRNPSFEDFYGQVRSLSQQLGCRVPNIREGG